MKLKFEHYILFCVVILVSVSLFLCWRSPVTRALRDGKPVNLLVIGTDLVENSRHSDTLVFLSYSPANRFLNIISIPRDTHFSPAGYRFSRINEIYAYHYRKTNDSLLASGEVKTAVEQVLQNKVTIPYSIQVDYDSFRKLIDLAGGIFLDVDDAMHYDDNAGDLHIHFEPGIQHLNGQQALEYVRYRGKAGDIGRVFRQQRFLKAVLSRLNNPFLLMRLPQVVKVVSANIQTNLTFWDILSGTLELKDLRASNIRLTQLPGVPNREYWEASPENCAGLLDKIFPSSGTVTAVPPARMRVEVWNASGKHRLADRVNWILRSNGYDVVEWGTLNVIQKKTLIKDLTGDLRSAQQIASILSCGEVVTRYDTKRFVDMSVILGEDCNVKEETIDKLKR